MHLTLSEALLATGAICLFASVAALLAALYLASYRRILRVWARRHGYAIIHSELRAFHCRLVYRVTVRDGEGAIQKGWVRCGGLWRGPLCDAAEVRWDRDRGPAVEESVRCG